MQKSEELETFVSAALYITSPDLPPSAIAERLGLQPTRTQLKGEPVYDPQFLNALSPEDSQALRESLLRTPTNYFVLEVDHRFVKSHHDSSAQILQRILDELLGKIEPLADRLRHLQEHASVSLMCSYGSYHKPEWFVLPEPLVRRIAALGLSLTVLLAPLEGEKERVQPEAPSE